MGGKGENPQPLENNDSLTNALIKRHGGLEFKPSVTFLAKEVAIQRAAVSRGSLERKLKIQEEGTDLLPLRVEMATMGEKDKKTSDDKSSDVFLNQDEEDVYQETVRQFVNEDGSTAEDKESLCRTLTEVVFQPKVFLPHYKQWKLEWESTPSIKSKFPDFKKYVLEQGKAFIKEQRNTLIKAYLEKFQKNSMPKSGTEEQQKTKLDDIQKKTLKFVDAHQDELLKYSTLDESDPKREVLFKKFVQEAGISDGEIVAARELFEDIVNAIGAAYVSQTKYDAVHGEMADVAQDAVDHGTEINKANWDKVLNKKLKQSFPPEVIQQQQTNVVYQAPEDVGNTIKLSSVKDVINQAGGLTIMDYDPVTKTYTLRYPNNTEFLTTMKIIPKPGSASLDDATFVFEDKYADKNKGNEVRLTSQNLRGGCNLIFLKYLANGSIPYRNADPNFSVNDTLKDAMVSSMFQRLFSRDLNDMVLTPNLRNVSSRFLEVLMKGDETNTDYGNLGSFEKRVQIMDTVLNNPIYAGKLFREFQKMGSVTFTVSTLLKLVLPAGYKPLV